MKIYENLFFKIMLFFCVFNFSFKSETLFAQNENQLPDNENKLSDNEKEQKQKLFKIIKYIRFILNNYLKNTLYLIIGFNIFFLILAFLAKDLLIILKYPDFVFPFLLKDTPLFKRQVQKRILSLMQLFYSICFCNII